ncbi:hypothetical protein G9X68_27635 [Rhizobium sp. WYCCWR 11279]|nr:hypothetical protein [Rhizobium changzhiense]NNU50851.1 hypothetical protein [Rhizobium changzhiense]
MVTACAKLPNGSGCTIANLFPKTSCWSTSTDLQRLQRRDPGAGGRANANACPYPVVAALPNRSIRADAITPGLGGVGPMTIMSLMHNSPSQLPCGKV